MKRITALGIVLLVLFVVSGCGNIDNKNVASYYNNNKNNSTSSLISSSEKIIIESSSKESYSLSEKTIETEFYTLEVPEYWNELALYKTEYDKSGGYALNFYEKQSYNTEEGGWLFGIDLITAYEDYSYFPSYELLGSLKVSNNSEYNVVVMYPTDVQFSEDSAKNYKKMENDIVTVLETVAFKNDCIFTKSVY